VVLIIILSSPAYSYIAQESGFKVKFVLPEEGSKVAKEDIYNISLVIGPFTGFTSADANFKIFANIYTNGIGGNLEENNYKIYFVPEQAFTSYICEITPYDLPCIMFFSNATLGVSVTVYSLVPLQVTITNVTLEQYGVFSQIEGNIGKFFDITATIPFVWARIRVNYTQEQLPPSLDETTLRIWKYNLTTGLWEEIPDSGVDTLEKYVWANVTEFTIFAPFGEIVLLPRVTLDIDPNTLNLKSKGKWITAYIEIPGWDLTKIDLSSIRLNKTIQPEMNQKYGFVRNPIGDYDEDGIPDFMVKFDRKAVQNILVPGLAILNLTGEIDGIPFESTDRILVIGEEIVIEQDTESMESGSEEDNQIIEQVESQDSQTIEQENNQTIKQENKTDERRADKNKKKEQIKGYQSGRRHLKMSYESTSWKKLDSENITIKEGSIPEKNNTSIVPGVEKEEALKTLFPTPTPEMKSPGFEILFALIGLLMYIFTKKYRKAI
jgi:hypothetical protein